jgi:hypothetical protein
LGDTGDQLTQKHEKTMQNLSPSEASIISLFLDENTKVIKIKYDSIVKVLIRNDVLKCLEYSNSSASEIMIREWAWEWINKNESKLRAIISQ